MSGKTEVKGRFKEAVNALTGNDNLRKEGKTDQAVGKGEQAVQKVAEDRRRSLEAEFAHHLVKPSDLAALL